MKMVKFGQYLINKLRVGLDKIFYSLYNSLYYPEKESEKESEESEERTKCMFGTSRDPKVKFSIVEYLIAKRREAERRKLHDAIRKARIACLQIDWTPFYKVMKIYNKLESLEELESSTQQNPGQLSHRMNMKTLGSCVDFIKFLADQNDNHGIKNPETIL